MKVTSNSREAGSSSAGQSSVINNPVQVPKLNNFSKPTKFQVPKGRDFTGFRRGSR